MAEPGLGAGEPGWWVGKPGLGLGWAVWQGPVRAAGLGLEWGRFGPVRGWLFGPMEDRVGRAKSVGRG